MKLLHSLLCSQVTYKKEYNKVSYSILIFSYAIIIYHPLRIKNIERPGTMISFLFIIPDARLFTKPLRTYPRDRP